MERATGTPAPLASSSEKLSIENKVEPGTIIAIEQNGIVVATGNEIAIKITDLQPAGKKRMHAESFLRGAGATLTTGMKLGEHHE